MTAAEEKRLSQLEEQIKALTALAEKPKANNWLSFGDFTAENRMSRTRLKSLIAKGMIEAEPMGRVFLYRWKA